MPKRTDISSILIIGAGPIVIGQACEFDYSGTQAWARRSRRRDGRAVPIGLEITQSFQAIGGHAEVPGRRTPLHGAHLGGSDIHFALDVTVGGVHRRHSFRGRVAGDTIAGAVACEAARGRSASGAPAASLHPDRRQRAAPRNRTRCAAL
ncbi:MAG: hypothetical protein M5U07_10230 [Xanthobacteraceae bacterium]|nr:hypothetical protein [Xanthobacteraceae bacterium]